MHLRRSPQFDLDHGLQFGTRRAPGYSSYRRDGSDGGPHWVECRLRPECACTGPITIRGSHMINRRQFSKGLGLAILAAAFLLQASVSSAEDWRPPTGAEQTPLWPAKTT